jgi:hypothetical protein
LTNEGFAVSDGRNVLIDYYLYRERSLLLFWAILFEHVFEGGLEGMGEGIDLVRLALEASEFGCSSEFDPYREGSRRDAAM